MQECWAAEPNKRPFLGTVEPRLEKLHLYYSEKLRKSSRGKKTKSQQMEVTDNSSSPLVGDSSFGGAVDSTEKGDEDDIAVVVEGQLDEDRNDEEVEGYLG